MKLVTCLTIYIISVIMSHQVDKMFKQSVPVLRQKLILENDRADISVWITYNLDIRSKCKIKLLV